MKFYSKVLISILLSLFLFLVGCNTNDDTEIDENEEKTVDENTEDESENEINEDENNESNLEDTETNQEETVDENMEVKEGYELIEFEGISFLVPEESLENEIDSSDFPSFSRIFNSETGANFNVLYEEFTDN